MSDVSATLISKTDQLNAVDVREPITFTVTSVRVKKGDDQPLEIHHDLDPSRCFRPCRTVRRVIATLWGVDSTAWVGRRMTVYSDPAVSFGGIKTGGLRVSAMSHIGNRPATVRVVLTRGKYGEVVVQPLPDVVAKVAQNKPNPTEAAIGYWTKQGLTIDELQALVGCEVGAWGDSELAQLRGWYERISAKTATIDDMRAPRSSDEVPDAS